MSCKMQAERLLVEPFKKARLCGPILIVIDALDKSGEDDMDVKTSRKVLVKTIVEEFPEIPSSIKILITSRDEGSISRLMPRCRSCLRKNTGDLESTEQDILKFIQSQMDDIRTDHGKPSEWPGEAKMQELASYADGLFICADVACKFIADSDDPAVKLRDLLAHSVDVRAGAEEKLDRLYLNVIGHMLPIRIPVGVLEKQTYRNWHYVIDSIVTLKVPLTFGDMDILLGLSSERDSKVLTDGRLIKLTTTRTIISNLRPILRIDGELKEAARLLHKSIYDYLTRRAGSHILVDTSAHNYVLGMQCLEYMNHHLREDICDIGDATLLNSEVVDLSNKIRKQIPEVLCYSCRHFVQHLIDSDRRDSIMSKQLVSFLTEKLFQWMEVMGLLEELEAAEQSLHNLSGYLKGVEYSHSHIALLVDDASSLLRNFKHAIKLSTLHIYKSALVFSPKSSMLFKNYVQMRSDCVSVISSHPLWTSSLRTLEGHTDDIWSVVFSPDGKKLASASSDKTVRLWDVESGVVIGSVLEGHTESVWSVVFSPDGKKLASASEDSTVRLWDVESATATGKILEGHTDSVWSAVFSPDGEKLASASADKTARLWDVESCTAVGPALEGHAESVISVVFSPDGQKLASASSDKTLRLWDVQSGTTIGSAFKGHTDMVWSVVFSPDGNKLASASSDKTVRSWNVELGTSIGPALEVYTGEVRSVAFSTDGKKLASVSSNKTVRSWNVGSGTSIGPALGVYTGEVRSVAFLPDGKKLASAPEDETVRLWDVESSTSIGCDLEDQTQSVRPAAFSPNGKMLASASDDQNVRLWDVESGTAIGSALEGHTEPILSIVFSPDGKKLASTSEDKTVRLWDVESSTSIGNDLEGHTQFIVSVGFSPDGKKLASASNDSTVRLWDVESGTAIGSALEGHTDSVRSVVFSPDGKKLASASVDSTVRLWNTESGTAIESALEGHTGVVWSVVFSPDGKNLASASADKTARLWDVDSGTAVGSALEGHTHSVNLVIFSPDGKKLASASIDFTVRLWDVESGTAMGSAFDGHHHGFILSIVFSLDGRKLAYTRSDETMNLWDVESGQFDDVENGHDMTLFKLEAPTSRHLRISSSGFLSNSRRDGMIWIPAHLRGYKVISRGYTTIICGSSGAMTFLKNFDI